jgi:hypothetical protein
VQLGDALPVARVAKTDTSTSVSSVYPKLIGYGSKKLNIEFFWKKQKLENLSDKSEKPSNEPVKPVSSSFFF